MEENFQGARMQEKHYNTVQYRIPLRSVKLSQIFGAIERNRIQLGIEDASVNQTNLEDIFIEFAKRQSDLTDGERSLENFLEEPPVDAISLSSSSHSPMPLIDLEHGGVRESDVYVNPVDPAEPESTRF